MVLELRADGQSGQSGLRAQNLNLLWVFRDPWRGVYVYIYKICACGIVFLKPQELPGPVAKAAVRGRACTALPQV